MQRNMEIKGNHLSENLKNRNVLKLIWNVNSHLLWVKGTGILTILFFSYVSVCLHFPVRKKCSKRQIQHSVPMRVILFRKQEAWPLGTMMSVFLFPACGLLLPRPGLPHQCRIKINRGHLILIFLCPPSLFFLLPPYGRHVRILSDFVISVVECYFSSGDSQVQTLELPRTSCGIFKDERREGR